MAPKSLQATRATTTPSSFHRTSIILIQFVRVCVRRGIDRRQPRLTRQRRQVEKFRARILNPAGLGERERELKIRAEIDNNSLD